MAKKIKAVVKIQIQAGKANPPADWYGARSPGRESDAVLQGI